MLQEKFLQGKLLILIYIILDCGRVNALSVILHNFTIGPPGLVARGCNTQWLGIKIHNSVITKIISVFSMEEQR